MLPESYCSRNPQRTIKPQRSIFERKGHYLSSDTWRLTLDLDINTYEEAISAIQADALKIEELRK